ncbi:Sodium/calcium exchanger 2 [Gryllus bimaculatus]|nr:Sodium/calcium exchanger 2 [Gryllus bimaculatus]
MIHSSVNDAGLALEAEQKRPEDRSSEEKIALLGRPKLGEMTRAQIRVKESKEFKRRVAFNSLRETDEDDDDDHDHDYDDDHDHDYDDDDDDHDYDDDDDHDHDYDDDDDHDHDYDDDDDHDHYDDDDDDDDDDYDDDDYDDDDDDDGDDVDNDYDDDDDDDGGFGECSGRLMLQNTVDKLVQRANASILIGTSSWKEQFVEALTVSAEGYITFTRVTYSVPTSSLLRLQRHLGGLCLTVARCVLRVFSCGADMLKGYVTFVVSIFGIGCVTAIIGDVASHFGCTLIIEDSVTAIIFVALGTSVPGNPPSPASHTSSTAAGLVLPAPTKTTESNRING